MRKSPGPILPKPHAVWLSTRESEVAWDRLDTLCRNWAGEELAKGMTDGGSLVQATGRMKEGRDRTKGSAMLPGDNEVVLKIATPRKFHGHRRCRATDAGTHSPAFLRPAVLSGDPYSLQGATLLSKVPGQAIHVVILPVS